MFCTKCGAQLTDGSKFCENCGEPVEKGGIIPNDSRYINVKRVKMPEEPKADSRPISENIWLCPDGVYRWVYEFPMLKNPVILFTVWRVLGMAFAVVCGFTLIMDLIRRNGGFFGIIKGFIILFLVFSVISIIAYLILAFVYGWKYMVLFEMGQDKIEHIQMASQFEKAKALGWLTAMSAGSLSMKGLGISTAVRDRSVSYFESVRSVRGDRRRNTIYVNQRLFRNQIYVHDCDYDFVFNYIKNHAVNAKKING